MSIKQMHPEQYLEFFQGCFGPEKDSFPALVFNGDKTSANYENSDPKYCIDLAASSTAHAYEITVRVSLGGFGLLDFAIAKFPHCCAMLQMYGFSYRSSLKEQQVHDFLSWFLPQLSNKIGMFWKNNRLIIAMVEKRRNGSYGSVVVGNDEIENTKRFTNFTIPDGAECIMDYNHIYTYLKNESKFTTMKIMHNENTGARIHLLEAVFQFS